MSKAVDDKISVVPERFTDAKFEEIFTKAEIDINCYDSVSIYGNPAFALSVPILINSLKQISQLDNVFIGKKLEISFIVNQNVGEKISAYPSNLNRRSISALVENYADCEIFSSIYGNNNFGFW